MKGWKGDLIMNCKMHSIDVADYMQKYYHGQYFGDEGHVQVISSPSRHSN